jgi:hypothetical protein
MNLSMGLLLAVLFWACSSPSNPGTTGQPVSGVKVDSAQNDSADKGVTASAESGYDTLVNLEMVEYCLPYPKGYQEDFKADVEKGQHILISPDKQSKITMMGMFLAEEWDIIYHDVEAEIHDITMADPLHNVKTDEYFELSWREDEKIVWMKKWHREDDGETVTVRFEYPDGQSVEMQKIIAVVAGASTVCN